MSVLIKGMILPPTCSKCPMCREDDLGFTYSYCTGKFEEINGYGLNRRMDFCPLVDVPTPHGRLVDADIALEKIDIADGGPCYVGKEGIDNTPTVIEAEE